MTLDRNPVYTLFHEARSALYGADRAPTILGRVIALGGRSFTLHDLGELALEGLNTARTGQGETLAWRFHTTTGHKE